MCAVESLHSHNFKGNVGPQYSGCVLYILQFLHFHYLKNTLTNPETLSHLQNKFFVSKYTNIFASEIRPRKDYKSVLGPGSKI